MGIQMRQFQINGWEESLTLKRNSSIDKCPLCLIAASFRRAIIASSMTRLRRNLTEEVTAVRNDIIDTLDTRMTEQDRRIAFIANQMEQHAIDHTSSFSDIQTQIDDIQTQIERSNRDVSTQLARISALLERQGTSSSQRAESTG